MNRTILLSGALATLVSAACRTHTSDRYSDEDRFAQQQAGSAGTAQRDFDDRYDSQNGKSMGTPREAGYSYSGNGGMAYGGESSAPQTAGTVGTAQRDFDDRYDSPSCAQHGNGGQSYAKSGTGAGATSSTVASTSSASQGYGSTGPQTQRSATSQRDYEDRQDLNGRGAAAVGVAEASAPRQPQDVESTISAWPAAAQQAARQTISKYGPPNDVTNDSLTWKENGPWEQTIVHRQEIDHNFPMPHKDVLEQTVTMRVPPENIEDLTRFDGSLVVNRTRGTITAICDREEMNFAAINLANDIVQGKRTVEQARELLARTATEVKNGQRSDLVQRFLFDVPRAKAGDPSSRYTEDPSRRASGVIDSNPPKPLDKQQQDVPKDDTIDKDHPNKPNMDEVPDDEVPDKPSDSSTQKDDLDDGPGA